MTNFLQLPYFLIAINRLIYFTPIQCHDFYRKLKKTGMLIQSGCIPVIFSNVFISKHLKLENEKTIFYFSPSADRCHYWYLKAIGKLNE